MFFGGGGGPFGGMPGQPGMRGGPRGEVDNEEYYKLLEIPKSADQAEIKKAYRKAAMKHHPDKGGDEATFKAISEAYDVLSNPEKKELYDKHGKEGLEQGGGGGPRGEDLFSMFFGGQGGGGGRGGPRGPPKGDDVVHPLKVTLENLCQGKTVKLSINRQRVKYPEDMTSETAVTECATCRGRGVVLRQVQIGPGMLQQMQSRCPTCGGQGKSYKKGVKLVKEKKILEVYVEKGMKHRQKIVFSGEADEAPGVLPGDVVFILEQQEHDVFQRKGADLVMEKKISLKEALTGFSFAQQHPDGRTLIIKSTPGDIVKPNSIKCVTDGGMPIHKRPFSRGRLFIVFRVEFPDKLTDPQVTALRAALPGDVSNSQMPKEHAEGEEYEENTFFDSTADQIGQIGASAAGGESYDSDEEGQQGGARPVQCQQS